MLRYNYTLRVVVEAERSSSFVATEVNKFTGEDRGGMAMRVGGWRGSEWSVMAWD